MSEVFDVDAALAEKAREPFRFRFGGEEYELPPGIDLRAVPAITSGDLMGGFRRLFGAEQWSKIEAAEAVLDTDVVMVLLDAYLAHSGVTLGESRGSTGS